MNKKTLLLVEGALMIAMAAALEFVSKMAGLELPLGGSITFGAMLPIVLFAYRHGIRWGLRVGAVYSLVQMAIGIKTVGAFFMPGDSQLVFWQAILVCLADYVLAYTALGFGGVLRGRASNDSLGLLGGACLALGLRYLVHILSGFIFFGAWAEWFFKEGYGNAHIGNWMLSRFSGAWLALVYSVFYNGLYMIPEMILTAALAVVLGRIRPVVRFGQTSESRA